MLSYTQTIKMRADTLNFGVDLEERVKRAWRHSRPNVRGVNMWDVLAIDAPVTEFAHLVIEINAPILVREIIASWRDHTMWAQTSRVQDLHDWKVYDRKLSTENRQRIVNLYEQMNAAIDDNKKQDDYRLFLPMTYMTEFSVVVTWRSLVRMHNAFKQLMLVSYDPCVTMMFNDVIRNLRRIIDCVLSSIVDKPPHPVNVEPACLHLSAPLPLLTSEQFNTGTHKRDGIITVTFSGNLALRAQLVRHRYIHVIDELLTWITNYGTVSSDPLNTPIYITASAPEAVWLELVKKRSCWIAQADLWAPLLHLVGAHMSDPLKRLPCGAGVCTVQEDALQRVKGNDPGIPCPRHLQLHAPECFRQTPEVGEKMHSAVHASGSDDVMRSFWHGTINSLEKATKQ